MALLPTTGTRSNGLDSKMMAGVNHRAMLRYPKFMLIGLVLVGLSGQGDAGTISFSLGNSIGGNLGSGSFENEGATALDLTGSDFSASAATRPEFGALHARASVSFDLSSPGERDVFGATGWTDGLTISSPGLNGTSGLLNVSFLLDGSLTTSGVGFAGVVAGIEWSDTPLDLNSSVPNVLNLYTSIPPAGQVVAASIPFTFGTQFYFGSFLFAGAGTLTQCPSCELLVQGLAMTGQGSGSADFYNTLVLTGLDPSDGNGNPASDVQFSSASGTAYTLDGVVPEPMSLALLGAGLLILLCVRRASERRA